MQDQRLTITKTYSSSQLSVVLALITLVQFMIAVDAMIVQVALPSIGKEFGVSINGLQWIVTAYGLTLAGFLLFSGRSGDIYGHKKLFIIGILLFSIASLVGGLASSEVVLITSTLGWRWVFEINVPIGIVVSLLALKYISINIGGTSKNRHLDIYGAVTVTAGLMLLVYSLNIAQDIGFGSL